jgi:hypothetical protein
LSERQTDDLYVPHVAPLPAYRSTLSRHKAILDYLHSAGFTKSFEQFKGDARLVRLSEFPASGDIDSL